MKFILGKKLNMSQIYGEDGNVIPVTLVQAGPCTVTQVKEEKKDGYKAVQVGFGKKKKQSKSLSGHLKGLGNFRYLKEFRINGEEIKTGDRIDVSTFTPGDKVFVSGTSKGKGFQGVVKRYGFSGGPASHGHKDQLRMPGSIGATGPARVFKGTRMGGRTGGGSVTVSNLKIVQVDPEKGILAIKGAVPGARGNLIIIKGEGELKIAEEKKEEPKKEEVSKIEEVKKNEEVTAEESKDHKAPVEQGEEKKSEEKDSNSETENKPEAGKEQKDKKSDNEKQEDKNDKKEEDKK